MAFTPESELVCSALESKSLFRGHIPLGSNQIYSELFVHHAPNITYTIVNLYQNDGHEAWNFSEEPGAYGIHLEKRIVNEYGATPLILFSGGDVPERTVFGEWFHTIAQLGLSDNAYNPGVHIVKAQDIILEKSRRLDDTDEIFNSFEDMIEASVRLASAIRRIKA